MCDTWGQLGVMQTSPNMMPAHQAQHIMLGESLQKRAADPNLGPSSQVPKMEGSRSVAPWVLNRQSNITLIKTWTLPLQTLNDQDRVTRLKKWPLPLPQPGAAGGALRLRAASRGPAPARCREGPRDPKNKESSPKEKQEQQQPPRGYPSPFQQRAGAGGFQPQ